MATHSETSFLATESSSAATNPATTITFASKSSAPPATSLTTSTSKEPSTIPVSTSSHKVSTSEQSTSEVTSTESSPTSTHVLTNRPSTSTTATTSTEASSSISNKVTEDTTSSSTAAPSSQSTTPAERAKQTSLTTAGQTASNSQTTSKVTSTGENVSTSFVHSSTKITLPSSSTTEVPTSPSSPTTQSHSLTTEAMATHSETSFLATESSSAATNPATTITFASKSSAPPATSLTTSTSKEPSTIPVSTSSHKVSTSEQSIGEITSTESSPTSTHVLTNRPSTSTTATTSTEASSSISNKVTEDTTSSSTAAPSSQSTTPAERAKQTSVTTAAQTASSSQTTSKVTSTSENVSTSFVHSSTKITTPSSSTTEVPTSPSSPTTQSHSLTTEAMATHSETSFLTTESSSAVTNPATTITFASKSSAAPATSLTTSTSQMTTKEPSTISVSSSSHKVSTSEQSNSEITLTESSPTSTHVLTNRPSTSTTATMSTEASSSISNKVTENATSSSTAAPSSQSTSPTERAKQTSVTTAGQTASNSQRTTSFTNSAEHTKLSPTLSTLETVLLPITTQSSIVISSSPTSTTGSTTSSLSSKQFSLTSSVGTTTSTLQTTELFTSPSPTLRKSTISATSTSVLPTTTSTIEPKVVLFQYGDKVKDSVLGKGDDVVSDVIKIPIGFTCGCKRYDRIHVNTDGYITLGENFASSNPERLPFGTFTMVAPFWADIDLKGARNASVYYHLYDRYSLDDQEAEEADTFLQKAYTFMKTKQSIFDAFEPIAALLVTWDNVRPYPAKHSSESNTFQVLLITDGADTYTVFLYHDMNWNLHAGRTAVAGWQCGPNIFRQNPYSETENIFRLDRKEGNMDARGLWYYKLGHCQTVVPNPALQCLQWYKEEKTQKPLIDQEVTDAYSCPCSDTQLQLDRRFSAYRDGCFYETVPRTGASNTATRRCCYDAYGSLVLKFPSGGHFVRHSPFFQPQNYLQEDIGPRTVCCVRTDLCDLYLSLRPTDDCRSYRVPTLASYYGDPHIQTLDGLTYTYNGLGEYVLLQVLNQTERVFEIQARTAKVSSTSGLNATIFSAVVAMDFLARSSIQAELSDDRKDLIFYENGADISLKLKKGYEKRDRRLAVEGNGGIVTATFPSGVSISIKNQVQMLDVSVTAPDVWKNNSNVRTGGLLGTFNNNKTDDFMLPNGVSLPTNMTEEYIFHLFGEKWRTTNVRNDSLFIYNAGRTSKFYQHLSFVPVFSDSSTFNSSLKQEATDHCGSEPTCIFDYMATGDAAVANNTKQVTITTSEHKKKAANKVPHITGPKHLNVTVNQTASVTVNATDEDTDQTITLVVSGPTGNSTNTGTGHADVSYTWKPGNHKQHLSFHVYDGEGGSETVEVVVVICPLCIHGSCMDEAELSYSGVLSCKCHTGWTGDMCNKNVNGCLSDPCPAGSKCMDLTPDQEMTLGTAFNCSSCPAGYTLEENKCVDINECKNTSAPCEGDCTNTRGSYRCSCGDGYRLDGNGFNCTDINECEEKTDTCAVEGERCINTNGKFECKPCLNNTVLVDNTCTGACEAANLSCTYRCAVERGGERCVCPSGMEVVNKTQCRDINECEADTPPCQHTCKNLNQSFECSCRDGFMLKSDAVSCERCSDPLSYGYNCSETCSGCVNMDRCDAVSGCVCEKGWEGDRCERDVDECTGVSSPCTGPHRHCHNTNGSFSCPCDVGYKENEHGICENLDECAEGQDTCDKVDNSVCVDNGGSYTCQCLEGYTRNGSLCQDVDECKLNTDNCHQGCLNVAGSYNCRCFPGFVLQSDRQTCHKDVDPNPDACNNTECGSATCVQEGGNYTCVCPRNSTFESVNKTCVYNDPCTPNPCIGSTCARSSTGRAQCLCPIGFRLDNTLTSCTECLPGYWGTNCSNNCSCKEGAINNVCDNVNGSCKCKHGWTGHNCDVDVNECENNEDICGTNVTCRNSNGSYECHCAEGYAYNDNKSCEDIDECKVNRTCEHRCVNQVGSFFCTCDNGFKLEPDNTSCTRNPTTTSTTSTPSISSSLRTTASSTLSVSSSSRSTASGTRSETSFSRTTSSGTPSVTSSSRTPTSGVSIETIILVIHLDMEFPATSSKEHKLSNDIETELEKHYTNYLHGALLSLVINGPLRNGSVKANSTLKLDSSYPYVHNNFVGASLVLTKKSILGVPMIDIQADTGSGNFNISNNTKGCDIMAILEKDSCSGGCTEGKDSIPQCTKLADETISLAIALGVGIPVVVVFIVVVVVLSVCLCRRRRRKENALLHRQQRDPSNVREAFGSLTSAFASHGRPSLDSVGFNEGMYNRYYTSWETPTNSFKPSEKMGGAPSLGFYRSSRTNVPPSRPTSGFSYADTCPGPERREQETTRSNFSWDFLYNVLKPEENFRIQRPLVAPSPTQQFLDSHSPKQRP